jgi:predicted metal-dependent enzyme (double-stranded beta helix superfamily)
MSTVVLRADLGELVDAARAGGLELIARVVGDRAESWGQIAAPDPLRRTYTCVHRDDEVEVWVLGWCAGQATELHDHDGCAGAVYVVEGSVVEDRVTGIGGGEIKLTSVESSAGETFSFDGGRIHRVRHSGEVPAVSVHVYSPPIQRMGYYTIAADRTLARSVIDHSEDEDEQRAAAQPCS